MKFSAIDAEDGSPNFTSEFYRLNIDDGLRIREAIFAIVANGDPTFISLVQFIKNTIGATPEKIRYYDEENDLVTISSDEELQEALRISRLQGNELKIVVQVPSGGSSMSESTSAMTGRTSDSSVAVQTLSFTHVDDEGFPADFNPKDTSRGANAPSSVEASTSSGQMDVNQQPPPWFINYMEHFKDDVTTTITRKIMKRLQHSFSSAEERGSRAGRKAEMVCGSGRIRRKTESDTESPQPIVNAMIEEDHHTMGRRSSLDLACSVDCTGLAKSFEKLQITPSEKQDVETPKSDNMNAKFLLDETYPDGSKLPPGHSFTKGWWMQNVGESAWDSNTKLLCSWKTEFVFPEDPSMFVPHLQPGEQGLVTMEHVSPNTPGKYESYWRLAHDGVPFGDRVWCSIVVCDHDEPDEMTVCEEVVFSGVQDIILVQEPASGENERMIRAEEEECPPEIQHGRFISQTATPNNTPLVGSPMKSPEAQYSRMPANMDHVSVVDCNDKTIMEEEHVVDVDGSSVDSISGSLDSDSEFVVVPLPSCFNVDIPLDIDQDDNNNVSRRLDDKSASSRSSVELLGHEEGTPDHLTDLQPEWSHYDDHSYVSVMRPVVDGGDRGDNAENGHLSSLPPTFPDVDIPDFDLTRDYSRDGASASESSSPDANNNSSYVLDGQVAAVSSPSVELLDTVFQSDDDPDRNLEGISHQPDLLGPVVMQPVVSSSLTHDVLPQRPQSSHTITVRTTEDSSASSRIVHILPEGLLSATASVFNSAKTAFSALQWVPVSSSESYSPDEDWNNISQPGSASRRSQVPPHPAGGAAPVATDEVERLQAQLFNMGFCDRVKNAALLEKYNNFVERVIEELLKDDDPNWFVHRH